MLNVEIVDEKRGGTKDYNCIIKEEEEIEIAQTLFTVALLLVIAWAASYYPQAV